MAKVISFFNSKGGVGKTALTLLFADYLAYRVGGRVLAVDMDNPNYYLTSRRNKDKVIAGNPSSPLALQSRDCKPFDIIKLKGGASYSEDHLEKITGSLRERSKEFDYMLIDFPGHYLDNDPAKYLLHQGLIDLLVIPVNNETQASEAAVNIIKDTHSGDFKRSSGHNDGQPTVMLWYRTSALDRKTGCRFTEPELLDMLGIEFTRRSVNEIEGLKREPETDRFILNSLCYPVANIRRTCGYIETLFQEIKLRADGNWRQPYIDMLFPPEQENSKQNKIK